MNCQRMVTRVGEKIENRSAATWNATKVLEAIDESIQSLIEIQKQSPEGQDFDLDYADLTIATETTAGRMLDGGQNLLEWLVPEYMDSIRRIEDTTSSDTPNEIPHVPLDKKERMRDIRFKAGQHHWIYMRRSPPRERIGFIGSLSGVSTIRVWFLRRHAVLSYALPTPITTTAQTGSVVGTTTLTVISTTNLRAGMVIRIGRGGARDETKTISSVLTTTTVQLTAALSFTHVNADLDTVEPLNAFILPANSTISPPTTGGRIIQRNDVYVGAKFEMTNDPSPTGNLDIILECSSYEGSTRLAMFTNQLAVPVVATSTYAMVPNLPYAFSELVVVWAAMRLAEESGSQKMMQTLSPKLDKLMGDYMNALEERQHQTPQFVHHYEADTEI